MILAVSLVRSICASEIEKNLHQGRLQKAEARLAEEGIKREKNEAYLCNKSRRQSVIDERAKVDRAKEEMAMCNKNRADEHRKKVAEDSRRIAEERAREMEEKRDIIMQLRVRFKNFFARIHACNALIYY